MANLYKNHICGQYKNRYFREIIVDFISWLVVGALLMLSEFGFGKFYMLAVGLACAYPAFAAYSNASVGVQLAALGIGSAIHVLIVRVLRKSRAPRSQADVPDDIGQRVEVIEWLDECSARVMYQGKEWPADKTDSSMPNAPYGIIRSIQYGRLVISTEGCATELT